MGGSGGGGGGWGGSIGGGWGSDGAIGGGDAAGGAAAQDCPVALTAVLVGPAAGACAVGDILDVVFNAAPPPGRAVCVHRITGVTVGAIAGIPGLSKLLECLVAGVGYEAHIDKIVGGRVDVTISQV